MKMFSKLTIAALTVAALGPVAVHTIHAQVIAPVPQLHKSDAADAAGAKTYADWQGPLNQSFGARFLAHGAPWDPNGGATPSHGLTLPIFDGLDKMQVWHEGAEQNTP
jgi:hypothetical protein